MEKRKDWLIVTAIAAIVFAILSLILMVKLNSTLGELKELKAEKREAWQEVMGQKEENASDLATADQESGDTTVRLLDDMVQQQDSQGQWIDICTIQEFEQSDPVSAGRQKMEEIVRQHQEAETNGTDEENGGFSVASLKRENGLADATQQITVDKKGAGADKSANGNANNKKNKGNNNSQAVENTQTGQETGQAEHRLLQAAVQGHPILLLRHPAIQRHPIQPRQNRLLQNPPLRNLFSSPMPAQVTAKTLAGQTVFCRHWE